MLKIEFSHFSILREASFDNVRVLGIEGPAWSAARLREVWDDPVQLEKLMEFLERTETEPSLLGASAHLMAIARHPT